MKRQDEVAMSASADDENCASGLIGSVLSLIISILIWLQDVRCKNVSSKKSCPNTCDLSSALEKLTQFAIQADNFGNTVTQTKDCLCPIHKGFALPKETDDATNEIQKNEDKKNTKSGKGKRGSKNSTDSTPQKPENHAVYYAVDQADNANQDCIRCCKKFVPPSPKPESVNNNANNNVLFEVVAAEMVDAETQTATVEFVHSFLQTDHIDYAEKEVEAKTSCICTSTQLSSTSVASRHRPDTEDKAVQTDDLEPVETVQLRSAKELESDVETEDENDLEDCECEGFTDSTSTSGRGFSSPTSDTRTVYRQDKEKEEKSKRNKRSPRSSKRALQESDFDDYDEETTDYTEESEEEYPTNNSRRCLPSTKSKQDHHYCPRQTSYTRSPVSPPRQAPIRRERPPIYSGYEAPIYASAYTPMYHDPYTSPRYACQPQPYYQKITRTIHRGSPGNVRKAEYEVVPQERISPNYRSKLVPECPPSCKILQEKQSQYETVLPPARPMSPKTSLRNYSFEGPGYENELPVSDKASTPISRKLNSPKSTPPATPTPSTPSAPPNLNTPPPPPVIRECDVKCSNLNAPNTPSSPPPPKPEQKRPIPKKCVARCARRSNTNTSQDKAKKTPNQTQPVAYMPKQAIAINPEDVQALEVVEAPNKKALVADSYMSVERTKRKKPM